MFQRLLQFGDAGATQQGHVAVDDLRRQVPPLDFLEAGDVGVGKPFADGPRGNAGDDGIRLDRFVDERAGADHRAVADADALENFHIAADPHVVADGDVAAIFIAAKLFGLRIGNAFSARPDGAMAFVQKRKHGDPFAVVVVANEGQAGGDGTKFSDGEVRQRAAGIANLAAMDVAAGAEFEREAAVESDVLAGGLRHCQR